MTDSADSVSERLRQIGDEFAELDPRERLQLLLEYSERLPPLPAKYQSQRDAGMNRVRECQTPVFLWIELDGDRVALLADVAPEAPTVKGFVNLLREAFDGAPAAEVLAVDQNLVQRLGLAEALGMIRMRGLYSILFAVRKQVQAAVSAAAGP